MEVIKELQLLRIKRQNLEKEKLTHIYDKHSEFFSDFSLLQEIDVKDVALRNAECTKIKQQLSKIRSMVQKFRLQVENVQATPQFVEKLKTMMEDVEAQISNFKEQQRLDYEQLMRDEKLQSAELAVLEKRMETWNQSPNDNNAPKTTRYTSLATERDITADLPPEVAQFERFLQQTGGHSGGWDEYDHGTFMKYRNRYKGKVAFIKDVVELLPTKTEQEIRDHESWFQEYNKLNDIKKEAIQRWRERKELEKEELVANAAKSARKPEMVEGEDQQADLEQERHEQKLQLNRWKVERELRKAEEEEKLLRQQNEKKKLEEIEKAKKMEQKKKVTEYKMMREMCEEQKQMEEMLQQQEETAIKQQMAAQLVAKYRDRGLDAVREKKQREKREKEQLEREKQQRLDKLRSQMAEYIEEEGSLYRMFESVDYPVFQAHIVRGNPNDRVWAGMGEVEVCAVRDPQRLLRPTEVWKERQKSADAPTSNVGSVLNVQHRAIPTWRQQAS